MTKKYVFISGNVSGFYRTQSLIKSLSDLDYEVVKVPHFFQSSLTIKFLSKVIKFLEFIFIFPLRMYLLFKSDFVLVTAMNMKLANLFDIIIGRLFKKRVIVDFYFSRYEAEAIDRKRIDKNTFSAALLKFTDRLIHDLASKVIFLNYSEKHYYQGILKANKNQKYAILPLCIDKRVPVNTDEQNDEKIVCWWGTYIPLHGLEIIIRSFIQVENDIKLYIFGNNETKSKKYEKLIADHKLEKKITICNKKTFTNGNLEPFLRENCKLVLGSFGKTDKAKSVMPNKVVDALSFGLPVISGESSGLSEFISSHENGIISKMDENDLSNKINNFFDLPEKQKRILV